MVHIQKESTSAEVFRLKGNFRFYSTIQYLNILFLDELEALEILHQWQTIKLTPSLVEFVYCGRFTVTIPCIKFKPLPTRITIQSTKASKFERDSFPKFTDMMIKGALKLMPKLSNPTLRSVGVHRLKLG